MLFYIKTALIGTFSLLLSSCDSSDYMAITTGSSVGGVVVDGYISGATVCADINDNSVCDLNEPQTTSKNNGTFVLDNVVIKRENFIPIIAYGGKDSATDKNFVGQLKATIDSSQINNTLIISPITDLVTNSFLSKDENRSVELLENIKETVANILNITIEDINKDPLTDKKLFIKSQEIQHAKNILQTIIKKHSNDINTLTLQKDIKNELLLQELDLERSIITLEANHKITIPTNEKDFVIQQFKELQKSLEEASENILLTINNLNILQKDIDTQQEKAITKLLENNATSTIETVKIDTTKIEVVKNMFYSANAEFDEQACSTNNSYNSFSNNDKTMMSDEANGLSLVSQYTDVADINDPTVTIYYPNLTSKLSNDVTVIFKEHYYFQFDKNWIYNEKKYIYIQTPQSEKVEAGCFRFELNSQITNKTEGTQVYRYSKSE